jgi:hypothetical protein
MIGMKPIVVFNCCPKWQALALHNRTEKTYGHDAKRNAQANERID